MESLLSALLLLEPSSQNFQPMDSDLSSASGMQNWVAMLLELPSSDSGLSSLAGSPAETSPEPLQDFILPSFNGTFVRQPFGRHFRKMDTRFVIHLGHPRRPKLSSLKILVVGPSGAMHDVHTSHLTDLIICCCFRSCEVGLHVVSVSVGPFHLPGSPFHIVFERTYLSMEKPVASLESEESKKKPETKHRKPWGITSNTSKDQLLATDRELHQVMVYSKVGRLLFTFGGFGNLPGCFNRPTGIAYDALNDRVFVTDKDNHRVQVFSPTGIFMARFGQRGRLPGQFSYPWGIAVSRSGLIVVADSRNHRLQLFSPEFQLLGVCQPQERGINDFGYPRGVAFDLTGTFIYASDFNSHMIFKLSLDFSVCSKIIEKHVRRPSGLAVNEAGNLLVADSRNNVIKVFSSGGHFVQSFGSSLIPLPTDVAVMKGGCIAVFDYNGKITTF